jgi:hypothetical protein
MARPKKDENRKTKRKAGPGRPKQSKCILQMILERDGGGGGTFEELLTRSGLARATLSKELRGLDTEGLLERFPIPPKEKGKGKRYQLVIRLSEKALDPVNKTLRHLEFLMLPPEKLDTELGRELLTDPVIDAIKEVEATRFSKFLPSLVPKEPSRARFDEIMLITALACYYCERRELPYADKLARKRGRKESIFPKATRGYTALPIVRQRGLVRQFDDLLDWIEPLLIASPLAYVLFQRESGDHSTRIGYRMGEPNISLLDHREEKERKKEEVKK